MGSHKCLGLPYRFEPPHYPLPHSGWLMRLLNPIIRILRGVMNCLRNNFPAGNTIATQFVGHDLPGFATVTTQQSLEESLRSNSIALGL